MLKIKSEVLFQKDYRISEDVSIFDYALAHPQEIDASAPIAVVSVDDRYMELNLSGAIIYESIENNENFQILCSKFVQLFGLSPDKAKESITIFIPKLIEKSIVVEVPN